jgi:hypothetical protein
VLSAKLGVNTEARNNAVYVFFIANTYI